MHNIQVAETKSILQDGINARIAYWQQNFSDLPPSFKKQL